MLPADLPLSSPSGPVQSFGNSDGVVGVTGEPLPIWSSQAQVMTDDQFETLRRQISAYATICQQLVEMHKAIVAQHNFVAGLRLGECMPHDPSIHPAGIKLTSRQRWTPSQIQLQLLEKHFKEGTGTSNKQRIKDITAELIQHGPISETNVYNWFQNRRARSKRRQQLGLLQNGESEVETDGDSPKEKKAKVDTDITPDFF